MTSKNLRLKVIDVVQETENAHSIVFETPAGVSYMPGQFLTLRLPHADGIVARCYSLSSAPGVDRQLKVTVKRVKGGRGSNWICDYALAGLEIDVLGPSGTFTPTSFDQDLLLLAGGSGITPGMSIIKSTLARGTGRVLLVYANRDERSVIFQRELQALVAENPSRLIVLHWLESVQGLPSVKALLEVLRPWAHAEAFICGPAPFMDCAAIALKELGLHRHRIHVERFTSLAGDPWREAAATSPPADRETVLLVEMDGQTHTLDWPVGQTLLDCLLDNGLDPSYSCREGACSACGVLLIDGDVTMENNSVLEQEDLDEGWRLACQSLSISKTVKVTYDKRS